MTVLVWIKSQSLQGEHSGCSGKSQPSFRVLSDTRFQGAPSTFKSFADPSLHFCFSRLASQP